ncbi:MAG: response regulator, partial [Candidatus Binatia bacterium]
IGLPGMNGYDVARTLRGEGFDRETMVAISGYGQAEDRNQSREAGFDHHLVKPIDKDSLMSILQGIGQNEPVAS